MHDRRAEMHNMDGRDGGRGCNAHSIQSCLCIPKKIMCIVHRKLSNRRNPSVSGVAGSNCMRAGHSRFGASVFFIFDGLFSHSHLYIYTLFFLSLSLCSVRIHSCLYSSIHIFTTNMHMNMNSKHSNIIRSENLVVAGIQKDKCNGTNVVHLCGPQRATCTQHMHCQWLPYCVCKLFGTASWRTGDFSFAYGAVWHKQKKYHKKRGKKTFEQK